MPLVYSTQIKVETDIYFSKAKSYVIEIRAPLVFINLLSLPMEFWVIDTKGKSVLQKGRLEKGEREYIYSVCSGSIFGAAIKPEGFKSSLVLPIVGKKKAMQYKVEKEDQNEAAPLGVNVDYSEYAPNSVKLCFYCKFWLVNLTKMSVLFKDDQVNKPIASQSIEDHDRWKMEDWRTGNAPPILPSHAPPLMFNSQKLSFQVSNSEYSETIELADQITDIGRVSIESEKKLYEIGLMIKTAPGKYWRTKTVLLKNR